MKIYIDIDPGPPAAMRILILLALFSVSLTARAEAPVRVFAAASLSNALNDIAARWQQDGHPAPSLATAASSALAKQIEAGAPADVFASADLNWMDYLDRRGKISSPSRVNLLGNTLVLIAPRGRSVPVEMKVGFDLAAAFKGKLCTGEPGVVPVGIYARQSLETLGWWAALQGRIVGTDDVRTALAFVERGECPLGIVYASDAAISSKVQLLASFPESTHKPIVYPFALLQGARAEAAGFLDYLKTSPDAAKVFQQYGFTLLKP